MATRKKTVYVSDIEDKQAGIKVPLNYDRDTDRFFAKLGDERFEGPTGGEVREKVLAAIKKTVNITWSQAIEISPLHDQWHTGSVTNGLGFECERKLFATFPDGKVKWIRWDAPESERVPNAHELTKWVYNEGPFTPPCAFTKYSEKVLYLPYSDSMWEMLTIIKGQIVVVQAMLFEHLGDVRAEARLKHLEIGLARTIQAWHIMPDTDAIEHALAKLEALEEVYKEKHGTISPLTSSL